MSCIQYVDRAFKPGIAIQPLGQNNIGSCSFVAGDSCGKWGLKIVDGKIDYGSKIRELVAVHMDTKAADPEANCIGEYTGGWWADKWRPQQNANYGSLLWKLRIAKPSVETLRMAIFYGQEAMAKLAPLIGSSITVDGELVNRQLIVLNVGVKGPLSNVDVLYNGSFAGEWLWGVDNV